MILVYLDIGLHTSDVHFMMRSEVRFPSDDSTETVIWGVPKLLHTTATFNNSEGCDQSAPSSPQYCRHTARVCHCVKCK